MAGNSQRRNRRTSNKKGAQVGSGGQRRRGLEGKGPTPPAAARKGHKKNRVANAKAKQAAVRRPAPRGAVAPRARPRWSSAATRSSRRCATASRRPRSTSSSSSTTTSGCARRSSSPAERGGIHLMEAPRPELDRMTNGLNHQGLVLQVPPYEYAHPEDLTAAAYDDGEDPLIVALDGVTDPRNLGAVVRSVSAFGGHGVVVPERRAAGMTAGAWKSSAGTAARTPVARVHQPDPRPGGATRRPASRSSVSPRTASTRSATWRPSAAPSSSSSAARARACPGWSARPATTGCGSRCRVARSR